MAVYIVTIISIFIYRYICFLNGVNERTKKMYVLVAFAHLAFVMALRAPSVGTDAAAYARLFMRVGSSSGFMSVIENAPVYAIYNKLLYLIFPFEQALLICTSIIICTGVGFFIYHFSDNVVFSTYAYVTLYFYFSSFNISRQYLASSLLLFAVCMVKRKKWIVAGILAILAVGIHNTAILFIPVLFFSESNMSRRKIGLMVLIGLIYISFNSIFFSWFVSWFAEAFPWYQNYLGAFRATVFDEGLGRNIYLSIFFLGIAIIAGVLAFSKPGFNMDEKKKKKIMYLLFPCMIGIVLGFSFSSNIAIGRIRDYFEIYMICLIPGVINVFKREKMLFNAIMYLLLLIPFLIQLLSGHDGVLPYTPFWNTN